MNPSVRSRLGPGLEFDLISRFLESAGGGTGPDVLVGPGDDCLILSGGVALSTDASVEGVHFRRDWLSLHDVGFRAAVAALSDLAGCAARPIGVLVSLAVPGRDVPGGAEQVMAGVAEAAESVGGRLLGGDLVASPGPLMIDVTVIGETSRPMLRSGAAPGDRVWVTGELGGAGAAVQAWQEGDTPPAEALRAYARPTARVLEALWLAERKIARAGLDLSDGLVGDAAHLAAAGGVAVVLHAPLIPIHPSARARGRGLELALHGGEDYELCFVTAAGEGEEIAAEFTRIFGVPLTEVGEVREGAGVFLVRRDGEAEEEVTGGFRHFGERSA